MNRFRAAAQVAAFFLIGIGSNSLVHGGDDGYRSTASMDSLHTLDSRHQAGSLDVTAAVDDATSALLDALRALRRFTRLGTPAGEVDVRQFAGLGNEASFDTPLALAGLGIAYAPGYAGRQRAEEMPALQHEYSWQLTYRSDVPDSLAPHADLQFDRYPGMDITLDDSSVVGLRFKLDYGWKR